ncbi:DUF2953 domain-containing protein [Sutcliffiella rhizosphaerae]|uniref:DUF2953 domain-containing protein n=1 Tax=Sutcliffiella rhizosphaerae TaxID=2880967 RepID=A0ABN8AGV0_9BACI|nr:DUF2953 domain-containing protein [Sutcliffiella rhizosphaerae]CAG9623346.1 hypothetical protein BACCIP111883_04147 [Sutcliffiella rhizosphaerae]
MIWVGVIVVLLFVIMIILTLTRITIDLYYHHAEDNDQMTVKIKAWYGLLRYTIDVPLISIDKDTASIHVEEKTKVGSGDSSNGSEKVKDFSPKDIFQSFQDTYNLVKHVVGMHEIVQRFLSKVEVKHLEWHTNIGVGDAAYTGVLVGAGWSIKGGIVGLISNYTKFQANPEISITPYFQQIVSQTLFKCMIRIRIGHAMLAGIRTVKYWKGGRPTFKTRPLSLLSKKEGQETM